MSVRVEFRWDELHFTAWDDAVDEVEVSAWDRQNPAFVRIRLTDLQLGEVIVRMMDWNTDRVELEVHERAVIR